VLTAATSGCRVVSNQRELAEWIGLTDRLYAGTPQFIPPLRQQLRDFYARKAPYFAYGEIEFLSVIRDGAVVGRTTAHTYSKLDEKLGAKQLLFGFTEFVDDESVFGALVEALDDRARKIGASRLFGPVNLLPNQSGGVVTSGFERRGFVDSPYNLPYYADLYERHGFKREFEGATFIAPGLTADSTPVERLFPFDEDQIEREQLEVRQANRRRIADELVFVRAMLNASFAQLGYYTEIDAEELAYQVDGLSHLLDERIALYLFKAGMPVAFILCIPDISEFVRDVNGNLNLLNQLRLLATRKRYRSEAICVIKGTVPEEQSKGYMRLLTRELVRNLRAAGYQTLRGTFIEDDNAASWAPGEQVSGARLHGVTLYGRDVI
jgi:GNAT superfamily N-acetyltransferase